MFTRYCSITCTVRHHSTAIHCMYNFICQIRQCSLFQSLSSRSSETIKFTNISLTCSNTDCLTARNSYKDPALSTVYFSTMQKICVTLKTINLPLQCFRDSITIISAFNRNNNKWSKQMDIRPHRHRRWMVQSYSPGGVNVPSHEDTLAQPGKYDLTCASFGPPESTTQTVNQSIQPFMHSSQKCHRAYPACPSPNKCLYAYIG